MRSMAEQLNELGIGIPKEPIKKVDTSKMNLKAKIDKAKKFIKKANKALDDANQAPDSDISYQYIDSAVLNYQRYCEVIKDILLKICVLRNTKLSERNSFSEVIRKSHVIMGIPDDMQKAINKLPLRNDLVHDYMNSEYYDEQVLNNLVNDYEMYIRYIDSIEAYCSVQSII